jgi:hypothetical protein
MTSSQIRDHIRQLECQQDIPPGTRAEWVEDAVVHVRNPKGIQLLLQAARRLKRGSKRPKYPIMYDVQPLLQVAFTEGHRLCLLDRALLQVRLTTLMRSVDAANIVWALFHQDNETFIKCTTKTGELTTFNLRGLTLETVVEYIHEHRHHPALFLFRSTVKPHQCLGAERLAKRLLDVMRTVGIDTEVFKSHSLRGATATHLLKKGVPHHLVQSRGAWTSSATLDTYYNRLHQTKDWERLLEGEHASVRHSADRAVLPSSASLSEPDEGRGNREDKRASTARAAELDALGVRRPLYDSALCKSCLLPMAGEAAYRCQKCRNLHHVRCMGHHASVGDRQLQYTDRCFLCALATKVAPALPSDHSHHSSSDHLIEDPMGVCS